MFHFMDPNFSIGMWDMLVQRSPMAWLLLGLGATIVYVVLSRFAVFRELGGRLSRPCRPDTQQSD